MQDRRRFVSDVALPSATDVVVEERSETWIPRAGCHKAVVTCNFVMSQGQASKMREDAEMDMDMDLEICRLRGEWRRNLVNIGCRSGGPGLSSLSHGHLPGS